MNKKYICYLTNQYCTFETCNLKCLVKVERQETNKKEGK